MTEKQLREPITVARIKDYHYSVGEDFLDQNESICDHKVFGGYLLAKYPESALDIFEVLHSKWGGTLDFKDVYLEEYDEENDIDFIYHDFATFCNLNAVLLVAVNKVLLGAE